METAALDASAASHPQAASVQVWAAATPALVGDYKRDTAQHSAFWLRGLALLTSLPLKPQRSQPEQALAGAHPPCPPHATAGSAFSRGTARRSTTVSPTPCRPAAASRISGR